MALRCHRQTIRQSSDLCYVQKEPSSGATRKSHQNSFVLDRPRHPYLHQKPTYENTGAIRRLYNLI